jgi:GDP-4-dehydro-6-deoxy-D-mannose reductase
VRALVTGAGGFVGPHLCRLLLAQPGWTVDAATRRPADLPVGVRQQQLDLLDSAATARLLATLRPTAIVHLAGQSSVGRSLAEPAATLTTNILSLLHVLEGCRAAGLDPQIVVAGSAEEYGDTARMRAPLTEDCPLQPANPYAVSKATQDLLGLQYHLAHGMRIVRLRLFNHIGPGQRPGFVLADFARQIARIEAGLQPPRMLVGNLAARRDFLDVRDVARAYLLAIERGRPGAAYNVGSGQARSIQEVLDRLLRLSNARIEVERDPTRARPADIPLLLADAGALRAATGWRPEIPFERSVADILADWRRRVARGDEG